MRAVLSHSRRAPKPTAPQPGPETAYPAAPTPCGTPRRRSRRRPGPESSASAETPPGRTGWSGRPSPACPASTSKALTRVSSNKPSVPSRRSELMTSAVNRQAPQLSRKAALTKPVEETPARSPPGRRKARTHQLGQTNQHAHQRHREARPVSRPAPRPHAQLALDDGQEGHGQVLSDRSIGDWRSGSSAAGRPADHLPITHHPSATTLSLRLSRASRA